MRCFLLCLLAMGCEKSAPTATSSGSGSGPQITGVARDDRPPVIATLPTDAAVAATSRDAAVPVDAAVAVRAAPTTARDRIRMTGADADAFAELLVAESGGEPHDMANRRPGADLGSQIADVRGSGGAVGVGTGGGGAARVDHAGAPRPDDAGKPLGRITVASKLSVGDSTLTADIAVSKILTAYMAGLKRCYKAELAKDPALAGQLVLAFTVQETGRTIDTKITGFSPNLDRCVSGLLSSWRFPVPKDKVGEPATARFTITMRLIPE